MKFTVSDIFSLQRGLDRSYRAAANYRFLAKKYNATILKVKKNFYNLINCKGFVKICVASINYYVLFIFIEHNQMYHEKHLSYAFNKVKDLATLARVKFVITSLVINLTASTVTLLLLVSYLCEIQSAYGPYHMVHMIWTI